MPAISDCGTSKSDGDLLRASARFWPGINACSLPPRRPAQRTVATRAAFWQVARATTTESWQSWINRSSDLWNLRLVSLEFASSKGWAVTVSTIDCARSTGTTALSADAWILINGATAAERTNAEALGGLVELQPAHKESSFANRRRFLDMKAISNQQLHSQGPLKFAQTKNSGVCFETNVMQSQLIYYVCRINISSTCHQRPVSAQTRCCIRIPAVQIDAKLHVCTSRNRLSAPRIDRLSKSTHTLFQTGDDLGWSSACTATIRMPPQAWTS